MHKGKKKTLKITKYEKKIQVMREGTRVYNIWW